MTKTVLKLKLWLFLTILLFTACSSTSQPQTTEIKDTENTVLLQPDKKELPVLEFNEIWAYVVAGREEALVPNLPVTDIAYFGAEVDSYGKLTDVPRRSALPAFSGRVHLVIACHGRALTHFVLKPGSPERREFIKDLINATQNYDGLNIDLENVPQRDGENFLSFLRELRSGLPRDKIFSVCVPARTRKLQTDVYDYEKITPLADRVFVMAYDEHWSGSRPGSVASIEWCRSVARYSLEAIGREKLVMGLPFYGRAWGDYSPSRALVYSSIEDIINDNSVQNIIYENGIPSFEYNKTVSIKVYYEDVHSLTTRMEIYKNMGIDSIGFWRLGQETPEVWQYLKINTDYRPSPPATHIITARPRAPGTNFTGRYTVKRGDTLLGLAIKYGVSLSSLAAANDMKINDILHIGRVLRVPE